VLYFLAVLCSDRGSLYLADGLAPGVVGFYRDYYVRSLPFPVQAVEVLAPQERGQTFDRGDAPR
jgi:hypothetical protein